MRIAVLGVGLIGGSIGLAARARLGAEVVGYDPDADNLARAVELGALDRGADTVASAVADAELVFCAAPVRVLGELVAEALAASGDQCVVSDVGSTKRGLIEALAGAPGGSVSSAAIRSPAPRPRASPTPAPRCSRGRAGI